MVLLSQQSIFPSLDFPNRTSITAREVADRLAVTVEHIANLIEAGALTKESPRSGALSRTKARIHVADYQAFIRKRTTRAVDFDTPPRLKFASLDFDADTPITSREVASKLGCSDAHVVDLIVEGELCALDMRGINSKRGTWRIPIEAYRHFMRSRIRSTANSRS